MFKMSISIKRTESFIHVGFSEFRLSQALATTSLPHNNTILYEVSLQQ